MAEGNVHSVTVEGTTELLPFEADAPSSDAWARALTHAAARGRTLATALGDELGQVLAVEERPGQRETAELRLAVTYALGSGAAYLLLGIVGVFSPSLLGIVPIGGYDVYLHLVLAVGLAGCGFWALWFAPQRAPARA